jgi:hypothetical protein
MSNLFCQEIVPFVFPALNLKEKFKLTKESKICFVGSGKLSQKYGDIINKYDIVVRFNDHSNYYKNICENYDEYYGTNIDIMCLCYDLSLNKNIIKYWLDKNVVVFMDKYCSYDDDNCNLYKYGGVCYWLYLMKIIGIDINVERYIFNLVPTSGMLFLLSILSCDNSICIDLFGFSKSNQYSTFYESEFYGSNQEFAESVNKFHNINIEHNIKLYLEEKKRVKFFN